MCRQFLGQLFSQPEYLKWTKPSQSQIVAKVAKIYLLGHNNAIIGVNPAIFPFLCRFLLKRIVLRAGVKCWQAIKRPVRYLRLYQKNLPQLSRNFFCSRIFLHIKVDVWKRCLQDTFVLHFLSWKQHTYIHIRCLVLPNLSQRSKTK